MEIVVVAKTKWGEFFCIGGIELESKKFVRLMYLDGGYQPANTPLNVGQLWDITYELLPGIPPHIEDIKVTKMIYVRDINLVDFITDNCKIWQGSPSILYESKLKWQSNGSGYLNDKRNVPINSVGFWKSKKDLTLDGDYYIYKKQFMADRRLKYKGTVEPISVIPAGTLIRVSLAKWWHPYGTTVEDRCYLQLSGWYF